MRPGEGKFGVVMVKLCALPLLSRMTGRAVLRETCLLMIRVRGFVVV